jgi:hypothetical protein
VAGGKIDSGVMKQGGVRRLGFYNNFDITLSAGVLTITGQGGTAISPTNYGWLTVPSTTAGQSVTLGVNAATNLAIQDDSGTDQIKGRWGTTASVAWGSEMPIFLGYANYDNTAANGRFFLTRNPMMTKMPASANNIGIAGTAPATSAQTNCVLFGATADPGMAGKPAIILGNNYCIGCWPRWVWVFSRWSKLRHAYISEWSNCHEIFCRWSGHCPGVYNEQSPLHAKSFW